MAVLGWLGEYDADGWTFQSLQCTIWWAGEKETIYTCITPSGVTKIQYLSKPKIWKDRNFIRFLYFMHVIYNVKFLMEIGNELLYSGCSLMQILKGKLRNAFSGKVILSILIYSNGYQSLKWVRRLKIRESHL